MNTIISNVENLNSATSTNHEPAINPTQPASISLEAACQYACHTADEVDSKAITQMLMAQYMMQGLCNPELAARIVGIPERRKQLRIEEEWRRLHPKPELNTSELPAELRTPAAINIWKALYAEAMVDKDCQTLRSRTDSGLMAKAIASKLGIRQVWITFEKLWGMRNLKSAYDKALDYESCWDFKQKLDAIIT